MLGLATRLVIAERVLDVISGVDPELAQLLSKNKQWCMVGALGRRSVTLSPTLCRHRRILAARPEARMRWFWKQILKVAVGDSMENVQSVVPALRTLTNALISSPKYDHGHGR
jgi:hypothetical protein